MGPNLHTESHDLAVLREGAIEKNPEIIASLGTIALQNNAEQEDVESVISLLGSDLSLQQLDTLFNGVFQYMLSNASKSTIKSHRRNKYLLARHDSLEIFTRIAYAAASNSDAGTLNNILKLLDNRNHPDFRTVSNFIIDNCKLSSGDVTAAV
ncbi:MAG TPA: hypothetical protein VFN56_02755 [Candidatus Saccharimonadales bacterium]|nr:hypothetical protein [Candidatus Saccharimonadales bacterium]